MVHQHSLHLTFSWEPFPLLQASAVHVSELLSCISLCVQCVLLTHLPVNTDLVYLWFGMLINKAVQILMYSISKFMYLIFPGKRRGFIYECTWTSEESRYTDSQLEVAHPICWLTFDLASFTCYHLNAPVVVLSCLSLTYNAENHFVSFLVICIYFLMKYLFESFAYFLVSLFCLLTYSMLAIKHTVSKQVLSPWATLLTPLFLN